MQHKRSSTPMTLVTSSRSQQSDPYRVLPSYRASLEAYMLPLFSRDASRLTDKEWLTVFSNRLRVWLAHEGKMFPGNEITEELLAPLRSDICSYLNR